MSESPAALPFRLEVSRAAGASEVSVEIGLDPGAPPDAPARVREIAAIAVEATNRAMFPGKPDGPSVAAVSVRKERSVTEIRCSFGSADPGVARILLNMLAMGVECRENPLRVRIQLPEGPDLAPPNRDLLGLPFPPRSASLPFEVLDSGIGDPAGMPVIRIAHVRALAQEEAERLFALLSFWDRLVSCGSFARDPRTREMPQYLHAEAYLLSPSTLEHSLYGFRAAEQSFDALLNGLNLLHRTLCPVRSVEIQ